MDGLRFAVLDVETTHGDPTRGHVLEVAVVVLDGREVRMTWDSLVHPRMDVPPFIRKLTGIRDRMLYDAPHFIGVVNTLQTLTEDRILVAHNVRYDLTAMSHEFARTGLVFERHTLCTERAARRLVPQAEHYNLGSLCRYFGIPFTAAHRALPDAEATAQLLLSLIDGYGLEQVMQGVVYHQLAARA